MLTEESPPAVSPEAERLAELRTFEILDTPPEEAFDELTALAAHICEAPFALITFVDEDRQWFKSRRDWSLEETAREIAICTHAIEQPDLLVLPDLSSDSRFSENPLITGEPHLRFYAGAPLVTSTGHALGSLCVLDIVPRELTPHQELALRVLSRHVVSQLELRRSTARQKLAEEALQRSHLELERRVEERTRDLQSARAEAETARGDIQQMVDRISDGLVALDPQWRYTYVNENAGTMLGRDPSTLIGKCIWDEFRDGIEPAFRETCVRCMQEQKPITIDTHVAPWERWFENRLYPSANGLSIFFREITDRRTAELKLERERAFTDAIVSSLPGSFYLFDQEGRFLRWNRRAEEVTGLAPERFATVRPADLVAPADRAAVEAGIHEALLNGESATEARIVSVTGEERWHLCTGRRTTVDGKVCIVGLGIDISERRRAEEQLRDAQSRLQLAVRASAIGLWDWDVPSGEIFYSAEWKAQLGYAPHELSNTFEEWRERLHPEDRAEILRELEVFLASQKAEHQSEVRLRHRDGSYRWIFTRAQLQRGAEGEPQRMFGCHIDMTGRRETEERLRQQHQQLRALAQHLNSVREEEAARIARELHDELGSTLTALKIDISRIAQQLGGEAEESLRARLKTILATSDQTIQNIRKLCLELRPAMLDQLGLSAAVEWQVAEFQTRTGIVCDLVRPENLAMSEAGAVTIFRILQELLTNITRHAQATRASVQLRQDGARAVLEVSDNGRGAPADALARTDRFGLLGVRERAMAVGGVVDFQSSSSGTRVAVAVPTG
jgi:PAS domain S-box-containing protein